MSFNESQPYKVSMLQVWILSDKWLSKYGLSEMIVQKNKGTHCMIIVTIVTMGLDKQNFSA